MNICAPCHLAKQHKLNFPLSKTNSQNVFDLIHIDIWGHLGIPSLHVHKYFLTIVDDFSRHTWVHLMKNKSETRDLLQSFIVHVKNQFCKNVKIIRTDNGKEFYWKEFYEKHGIIHQTSCNETPQQNSIVERKHQHILNITRCLIFQSRLPKAFWCYVVLHSVFLINRILSPVIHNKSPYELLYNTAPCLSHIKVFGCLCFASTLEQNRHKLDPRARKCIFLGFKQGTKGYVVMDIQTREVFISRNVISYESSFCKPHNEIDKAVIQEDDDLTGITYDDTHIQRETKKRTEEREIMIHDDLSILDEAGNFTEQEQLRRFTRTRKTPTFLEDSS